jgi:hypothetical protein
MQFGANVESKCVVMAARHDLAEVAHAQAALAFLDDLRAW